MTVGMAVPRREPTIASVGQRFVAGVIDGVLLLPVGFLLHYAERDSRAMAIALAFPSLAMGFFYTIWFHGRFGQTVGKMLTKIRVVRVDGTAIGWRRSFMRSVVDLVLALVSTAIAVSSLVTTSDAEYLANVRAFGRYVFPGAVTLGWVVNIWVWSEILVALTNRRRRAVHDFMAGTVVLDIAEKRAIPG